MPSWSMGCAASCPVIRGLCVHWRRGAQLGSAVRSRGGQRLARRPPVPLAARGLRRAGLHQRHDRPPQGGAAQPVALGRHRGGRRLRERFQLGHPRAADHAGLPRRRDRLRAAGGMACRHRGPAPRASMPMRSWRRSSPSASPSPSSFPRCCRRLLDAPAIADADLSSMRNIVTAAAPVPVPLLKRAVARLGPIFSVQYGATETAGTVMFAHEVKPDGDERDIKRIASVGHPGPQTRIRVVDDAGNDCASRRCGRSLDASPTSASTPTGTTPRRRWRRCATAGIAPATSATWTKTATCSWSIARRT